MKKRTKKWEAGNICTLKDLELVSGRTPDDFPKFQVLKTMGNKVLLIDEYRQFLLPKSTLHVFK
jgi:hypothetical protein